ncbi:hypothetical protein ASPZODRAFT_112237, partial [Penicilliopsis zonata CBS 506.65]
MNKLTNPPACPFCNIAAHFPASRKDGPESSSASSSSSFSSTSPAHIILSTQHLLAFLDIMPLTRGHVLITTRHHFEKLSDIDIEVSKEIGKWLPIVSRAVMITLFGEDEEQHHWNVVQNNGYRAAQQVPHLHFHVIPRPPLNSDQRLMPSFVMFGRGQRDELDDEEGKTLAAAIREQMVREVEGIDLE